MCPVLAADGLGTPCMAHSDESPCHRFRLIPDGIDPLTSQAIELFVSLRCLDDQIAGVSSEYAREALRRAPAQGEILWRLEQLAAFTAAKEREERAVARSTRS